MVDRLGIDAATSRGKRMVRARRIGRDEPDAHTLDPAGGSRWAALHPVPQQRLCEHDEVPERAGGCAARPGAHGIRHDARKKLYAEAQRQIVADLPMVPLLFGAEYAALRAPVNGFEWIPDQIPRFRDLWKSG